MMPLSALLRSRRSALRGWPLVLLTLTATACLAVLVAVFLPAYRAPLNKTYGTRFGYAAVQRQLGRPFPVQVATAEVRPVGRIILGEGLVACQSVLVPAIATAGVVRVHVQEGQAVRAGDLLAELDDSLAQIKVRSARLAVQTAEAELQRVLIGSAYVLAQERPEKDRINLEAAERQLTLLREKERMFTQLAASGAASRVELIGVQTQIAAQERARAEAEFNLGMSTRGQEQSRQIAANAIAEARHVLAVRELEAAQFRIVAPCDGLVERVLLQPGEFNQDSGRPAFVLARDRWFEANFDQTAVELLRVGDAGEIHLEAFPGVALSAAVEQVVPLVTFNQGGPETNRPIRPKGSGSPEWPATFKARLSLPLDQVRALPGLTGFARVTTRQEGVAVPRAALLAPTAGSGLVWVLVDGRLERRLVRPGIAADGWVIIREGLAAGETVITAGQHILEEGDRVAISR